jgi:hypothetical protein
MTSVKMDPATIGLLISIALTVLDLLFGEGHIKKSLYQQRYPSKSMYGYGLEGYGMFGEGYRYPPLTGLYVRLPYQTKYGIIEKTVQVPSKKWAAAYFLNKKAVASNEWVKFLRSKMDDFRKEYHGKQGKEVPERIQRIRHKLMLEAIKRIPELAALEGLTEEDLIKAYYEGSIPRSRKQKTKLLQVLELPKNRERWAGSPARRF